MHQAGHQEGHHHAGATRVVVHVQAVLSRITRAIIHRIVVVMMPVVIMMVMTVMMLAVAMMNMAMMNMLAVAVRVGMDEKA